MKTSLELTNISFAYGSSVILRDFSLRVNAGETVCLLGSSGCGKSTVLKIIAGMLKPDDGRVLFGGEDFSQVPAEKREAVMMFQKPLLFPYLNVADNVAFGLKMRKMAKDLINEKVFEALKLTHLSGFEKRMPSQLSGGQEQRVALARALVTQPRVLLLDEPLSSLDANLRNEMRFLVRDLLQQLAITTVFVTHDQSEAVTVADNIAFMNNGMIEQYARPKEFFSSPKTAHAAEFFGWKVFTGKLVGSRIKTQFGDFEIPANRAANISSENVRVGFHPNSLQFCDGEADFSFAIRARILKSIPKPSQNSYLLKLTDGSVVQSDQPYTRSDTTDNGFADLFIPLGSLMIIED
ncbi:MAG: ABC transporter ATP-binding protein [Blastocatellia bacterium]